MADEGSAEAAPTDGDPVALTPSLPPAPFAGEPAGPATDEFTWDSGDDDATVIAAPGGFAGSAAGVEGGPAGHAPDPTPDPFESTGDTVLQGPPPYGSSSAATVPYGPSSAATVPYGPSSAATVPYGPSSAATLPYGPSSAATLPDGPPVGPAAGPGAPAGDPNAPAGDPDAIYIPIYAQPSASAPRPDHPSSAGGGSGTGGDPGAGGNTGADGGWGPPTAPPIQPAPPPPAGAGRRRLWPIVLVCAVISALVGGIAGFGGNRLAALLPPPAAVSSPPVSPSPSSSLAPPPREADPIAIAQQVLPSLVLITVRTGDRGELGSGFVIDADNGYVLTNNHVVAEAADGGKMTVTMNDGTQTRARIVGRSPTYDVAVIQLENRANLVPVEIGDSDAAQVGEPVVALGAPLGLQRTVTAGILSAKGRAIAVGLKSDGSNASSPDVSWINALQTDASINPGNSGGPLVDAAGRVIGIDTAALNLGGSQDNPTGSIGLGFAIPINQAHQIAQLLIADGKVSYPTMGLALTDDDQYQLGVKVSSVSGDGAAAKAGLKEGDVITKVGDIETFEPVQLIVQVRTYRPGDQVVFTYERDGSAEQATVTLGGKVG